jgi:hypothetical protein
LIAPIRVDENGMDTPAASTFGGRLVSRGGGMAAEAGKFISDETRKWGGVIRAAELERNKGDEE